VSAVHEQRRLIPAAAPVGIVCLLAAMVLWGLATELASFTAAGLLVVAGLWCLGAGWGTDR
jgi:hypothetical protein